MQISKIIETLANKIDRIRYHDERITLEDMEFFKKELEDHDNFYKHSDDDMEDARGEGYEAGFSDAKERVIKYVLEEPKYKKRGEMIEATKKLDHDS